MPPTHALHPLLYKYESRKLLFLTMWQREAATPAQTQAWGAHSNFDARIQMLSTPVNGKQRLGSADVFRDDSMSAHPVRRRRPREPAEHVLVRVFCSVASFPVLLVRPWFCVFFVLLVCLFACLLVCLFAACVFIPVCVFLFLVVCFLIVVSSLSLLASTFPCCVVGLVCERVAHPSHAHAACNAAVERASARA